MIALRTLSTVHCATVTRNNLHRSQASPASRTKFLFGIYISPLGTCRTDEYAGSILWCIPTQAACIPNSERHFKYSNSCCPLDLGQLVTVWDRGLCLLDFPSLSEMSKECTCLFSCSSVEWTSMMCTSPVGKSVPGTKLGGLGEFEVDPIGRCVTGASPVLDRLQFGRSLGST